jgi:hypothetical protein
LPCSTPRRPSRKSKITIGDITTVATNATVVSMPGTYDPATSSGLTDLATQVVKLLLVDVQT